jgi:hypothetical protein
LFICVVFSLERNQIISRKKYIYYYILLRGGRENKTEKKEPQGPRSKVAGWGAKN